MCGELPPAEGRGVHEELRSGGRLFPCPLMDPASMERYERVILLSAFLAAGCDRSGLFSPVH